MEQGYKSRSAVLNFFPEIKLEQHQQGFLLALYLNLT
jgi:hypothetical protein